MLLGDLGAGDGQYVGFVTSPLTDCGGPGDHTLDISFSEHVTNDQWQIVTVRHCGLVPQKM